jgi:hypothetical protein
MKFLVGIGVVVCLFYIAVRTFSNLVDDVTEYKYELLAQRFSISMDYVHRQWLTNDKPQTLVLEYFVDKYAIDNKVSKQLLLRMNEFGWPINIAQNSQTLDCMNLWMYFAHEEQSSKIVLNLTEQLIIEAKEIKGNCHFLHKEKFPNQLMFSYNSGNGQVVISHDLQINHTDGSM